MVMSKLQIKGPIYIASECSNENLKKKQSNVFPFGKHINFCKIGCCNKSYCCCNKKEKIDSKRLKVDF